MLHIKHLTATIEDKTILDDISFAFEDGETYALLGPNGSGKSTLAGAILGRPDIRVEEGSEMNWDEISILSLSPDKRSALGIFGSFQSPPPLPGVSLFSLLRYALPKTNALETKKLVEKYANELSIEKTLLSRGLHDGFSGGEKKKFEALLWALLQPKLAIFDELDTGVDVDALKTIGLFLKEHRDPRQTFIIITHSTKLLDILEPRATLVMNHGKISQTGDGTLAKHIIETEGFTKNDK